MVHKKYIKRDGKTFGPYLYQNYREKGITKTRYLGLAKKKNPNNWLFILGMVLLLVFIIGIAGVFVTEPNFFKSEEGIGGGELASVSLVNKFVDLFAISTPLNVFVQILSNYPPEIFADDEIFVCENTSLTDYYFNVRDLNGVNKWVGDDKNLSVFFDPLSPYFYITYEKNLSSLLGQYKIFSTLSDPTYFNKTHVDLRRVGDNGWAIYPEKIAASDGIALINTDINITLIEVNNPPISNTIGTQTISVVWPRWPKNRLYYDLNASDLETAKENLIFDIFIFNESNDEVFLFDINESGVIDFTANLGHLTCGTNCSIHYNVSVYINDTGIPFPHPKIVEECAPQKAESEYTLVNFNLTITDVNTAPNITENYPKTNETLIRKGTETLYFNISFEDEQGTIPDAYWYVYSEPSLIEIDRGNSYAELEYDFGCGVEENHTIKAVVTDGDLNDSIEWNVSIQNVDCPIAPDTGGGGGGIKLYCQEKWSCNEWDQCENLQTLIAAESILEKSEKIVKERCNVFNWAEEFCGLQTRICTDNNYCNTAFQKPGIVKECYYTENPNCEDEIKNCHEGSCEILIDCGGPCEACPTCSDKIQNQNEDGIDCGGVCNDDCLEYAWVPNLFKMMVSYSLIFLFIFVIILMFKQVVNYTKSKKMFGESSIKNKIIRGEKKKSKLNTRKVVISLVSVFVIVGLLFVGNLFIIGAKGQIGIPNPDDFGFLASSSVFGSLLRNLGVFYVSGPLIENGQSLEIGDETDNSEINKYSGSDVYFYANYTNASDSSSFSIGDCNISFQDADNIYGLEYEMAYNSGNELFEYTRSFDYMGSFSFNVNCSIGSLNINNSEEFVIQNTVPVISLNPGGYIDLDGNPETVDYWGCVEDILCIYDFKTNFIDPDTNDYWIYGHYTQNTTLTNFEVNESTGVVSINITNEDDAGDKNISLNVGDSSSLPVVGVLRVRINSSNDFPQFIDLTNQTFNVGDLFEYIIEVSDEENNFPFVYNISMIQGGNLLDETVWSVIDNKLNISFTPVVEDVGSYLINISVMDNNTLGNATTSQIVNFTVNSQLWNPGDFNYQYDENDLIEIELDNLVVSPGLSFNMSNPFGNFEIKDNWINFTAEDVDVGEILIEITANDSETSSPKIFNFTINNANDTTQVSGFRVDEGGTLTDSNIGTLQNVQTSLILDLIDDDFLITSEQKLFYDENLEVITNLEGPNETLFDFELFTSSQELVVYRAIFTPLESDLGDYNLSINISDANNHSLISRQYNLTIISNPYDMPNITFPLENYEFNLKENVSSVDLLFNVNHSVQDNLTYVFYIGGESVDVVLNGPGDNSNFVWDFIPDFNNETYGNKTNLTLIVSNPLFSFNKTWNLTINHTNAPLEFIDNVDKMEFDYETLQQVDLKYYFLDVDHFDENYLQNVSFNITSNSNPSRITLSDVSEDWTVRLIASESVVFNETLQIIAYDLNMSNESQFLTSVSSNYFIVNITQPNVETIVVPQPSSGGGSTIPVSLKIISPGEISVFEGEKIEIPIQLINSGKKSFNDLNLNVSALKDGKATNVLETKLDENYFKSLSPGQEKNLTLDVFFNTNKTGKYEILITAKSKSPRYTDWEKIYITLEAINESTVKELIVFTEEFIAGNPQCIEITEIINDAQKLLQAGDYINAKLKTEQALDSCKNAISQVTVVKSRIKYFQVSLYLVISILLALILGVIYYIYKRWKFTKLNKLSGNVEIKKNSVDKKI